jgi:hypothetical protein
LLKQHFYTSFLSLFLDEIVNLKSQQMVLRLPVSSLAIQTEPGLIDYSVCQLWAAVNATILASNATATGTPMASSTSRPTGGAGTISASGVSIALSALLMGLAVFV